MWTKNCHLARILCQSSELAGRHSCTDERGPTLASPELFEEGLQEAKEAHLNGEEKKLREELSDESVDLKKKKYAGRVEGIKRKAFMEEKGANSAARWYKNGIYLCASDSEGRGEVQDGPLMMAVQQVLQERP